MTAALVSRPWHRYLRISIRGLIVLVLALGGGFGWIVSGVQVQRDAVAAIEKSGGKIEYDFSWNNGKSIPNGKPQAPSDWWNSSVSTTSAV